MLSTPRTDYNDNRVIRGRDCWRGRSVQCIIVTVAGCADTLEAAAHVSWYSVRAGDSLTVYCNHSSEVVYHLHCRDNHWTGDVVNCTTSTFNPGH